jgi:GNAT superfamily N-acetyltransferase
MASTHEVHITTGYTPGAIGRIAALHGVYYARHWNFGLFFEAKVATELAGFLQRFDAARDGFWTAQTDNRIEGGIALDASRAAEDGAHLRWFIVSDAVRGRGTGRALLEPAMDLCRERRYPKVYLWTFAGLDAARHLYESVGFRLLRQQSGEQWGTRVEEQYFEWRPI